MQLAKARLAAETVLRENSKAPDFARPFDAFERALLARTGLSLGSMTGEAVHAVDGLLGKSAAAYSYLRSPPSDDLSATILHWEKLATRDPSLARYAQARLVETSYGICHDVAARVRTLDRRPARSFELVALASMLFACDRDRFRDVNWIRALDAAASARVDLEHLLAVDAEGGVWIAHFDGWEIVRYTPDGKQDKSFALPHKAVTSICFGGPDWRDVYVTTAGDKGIESLFTGELPPREATLFHARSDIPGVPVPETQFDLP